MLWARSKFSIVSKCDYVTNNIAETFNNWIRNEKSLPIIELMDAIRQKIMKKMELRRKLAVKLIGKVLPHIMKEMHVKSRGLVGYAIHKGREMTAEIEGVHRDLTPWRHTVNLPLRQCSCNKWQLTGIPCTHAISLICSFRNMDLAYYVDNYYSVAKFQAAYAASIEPVPDKSQWPKVDLGFKLWPPKLKRAAGRPRTRRIRGVEEGGSRANKKRKQCKRCGQFGHMQKTCNEAVYDSDAPAPAPPKPKRQKVKKHNEIIEDPPASPPLMLTGTSTLIDSPAASTRSRARALSFDMESNSKTTSSKVKTRRSSKVKTRGSNKVKTRGSSKENS